MQNLRWTGLSNRSVYVEKIRHDMIEPKRHRKSPTYEIVHSDLRAQNNMKDKRILYQMQIQSIEAQRPTTTTCTFCKRTNSSALLLRSGKFRLRMRS